MRVELRNFELRGAGAELDNCIGSKICMIKRSMKRKEFLDYIPGTAEFRIRRMEEERVKIPECPVMNEYFTYYSLILNINSRSALKPSQKPATCTIAVKVITFVEFVSQR